MCFEYQGIKFNGKKVLKLLNAYGQSRGGVTPPRGGSVMMLLCIIDQKRRGLLRFLLFFAVFCDFCCFFDDFTVKMTVNWSFLTIYRKIGPYPEMSVYKSGGISLYEDRDQNWCVLEGLLVCRFVVVSLTGRKWEWPLGLREGTAASCNTGLVCCQGGGNWPPLGGWVPPP